jgi:hypothetical protein
LAYDLGDLPFVQGVDQPTEPEPPAPAGEPIHPGAWDTRVITVMCRYLNSGFPVMVTTEHHAVVVVGYYMREGQPVFLINDDERGPYEEVVDPLNDVAARGRWERLMIPLPPRVFLTGETAESDAYETIIGAGFDQSLPQPWRDLANGVAIGVIQRRTFLVRGRDYKARLSEQGRDQAIVDQLRLARMAHWVWVVEFHDGIRAGRGEAERVTAEVVFDATSSDEGPLRHAVSYLDLTTIVSPHPGDAWAFEPETELEAWKSQIPAMRPEGVIAAVEDRK